MLIDNSYGKFKYLLYHPDGNNLPLIVVLHGSVEIGSDLSKLNRGLGTGSEPDKPA